MPTATRLQWVMPLAKDPERRAAQLASLAAARSAKTWTKTCTRCDASFQAGDAKRAKCPACHGHCTGCGIAVHGTGDWCKRCSPAAKVQRTALHRSIRGDANPAKRPEVGAKIAAAISGDSHPSRLHPEQGAAQAALMRSRRKSPGSRLEDKVALLLPDLHRQYPVAGHAIDFADPLRRLAVQVHGCWWHACPRCYPAGAASPRQRATVTNDDLVRARLSAAGWDLIEIWGHEVPDNPEGLVRRVLYR